MFLDGHVGRAMGFQTGVSILKRQLHVGMFYYGRSGPINPHTVSYSLDEGQTYKGKETIDFRADHGAFGVVVAPQFKLGKVHMDIPLMFGQFGAGFYLTDEDRLTPDGRRVSEWEDDLLGGEDAGFGWILEGGIRARTSLTQDNHIQIGMGLHYTHTIGYNSTLGGTDYYKAPRVSLFLLFGN